MKDFLYHLEVVTILYHKRFRHLSLHHFGFAPAGFLSLNPRRMGWGLLWDHASMITNFSWPLT